MSGGKPLARRSYMKQLHEQLVEPWLKHQLEMPTMPRKTKDKIREVLGLTCEEHAEGQGQPSGSGNLLTPENVPTRKRESVLIKKSA